MLQVIVYFSHQPTAEIYVSESDVTEPIHFKGEYRLVFDVTSRGV
jgi:hypothetical protein